VVLTGNPNSGKTTLFNALTGLRAKVGNYAGVTVERKEGRLKGAPADLPIVILDLPGTYSLSPQSLDEQIARDILFHRLPDVPAPDLVVVVVDASNLERNLYYATQVIELGYPTVIALNMVDVAEENGHRVDATALSEALGVPALPLIANVGDGLHALRESMLQRLRPSTPSGRAPELIEWPAPLRTEMRTTAELIRRQFPGQHTSAEAEALLLLTDEKAWRMSPARYPEELQRAVNTARERLEAGGLDWRSAAIEARYARAAEIHRAVTTEEAAMQETFSDRLDRVVTHRVWGTLLFVAVMALMFQTIFTFARLPMDALEAVVSSLGQVLHHALPPGDLNSLLVDGVVAGVGAVVVFLPQILLLFLFIGLLEDTGYMARAAFLMDRLMSKVGLHGKSFIPMLSSFACAIPGIMATRTIESPKDRLATILVAPLMSCSARLPVYTLLIAACMPDRRALGFFRLQGLTLLGMYLLGIVVALFMAWLFKRTLLRGEPPMLIMELPPYKRPVFRVVLRHMWDRAKLFLSRAGTIILGLSIVLWFLVSYPRSTAVERDYLQRRAAIEQAFARYQPDAASPPPRAVQVSRAEQLADLDRQHAGERLRHSFAGRLGHLIEPTLAPLGFDWKIGVGIVASFAAREVFVSTMSTVYNVSGEGEVSGEPQNLAQTFQAQTRPDGRRIYSPLTGLSLMVFYVFALQCVSTVAVVRRETNSWKWPIFQWLYMAALAWGSAFLTYQGGRLLGYG
jgi:ferrous iron transport protein B